MSRAGPGAIALLLALLCGFLALNPRANPLVTVAEKYQQDIAVASGATYISLRAINAALSFAQDVEVGGSMGLSANVQPLKWLEPIDDTVERISAAIFAVAVLTGVLSMSLAPVASVGFVLLGVALLTRSGCDVAVGWHRSPAGLRRFGGSCGMLGFAFAIGLPCAYALGVWGGDILTADKAAEASAVLDHIADTARLLVGIDDGNIEDRGWRETIDAYRNAAGDLWDKADEMLAASLTLVGIFVLRMVVLPLVLLLALVAITRRILGA
ncbi:hypothetical protein [Pseudooceanicola algae]|uniref:TrbL/VirB6 plasmid conjugal transfer protein n=1 Tax=Pseudooceanicola algae TaxID=1537215 RepID=A0A418SLG1_9RHOB|nr:hypothetical protein [Pseudooceanicola algae]QPM90824.1 hypothetical protein PSAL_020650 [Pseudooceanicola algae]